MRKHVKALIVLVLVATVTLIGTIAVSANGPMFGRGHLGTTGVEAVAKVLGMTTDELTTQLQGGKTLADLAEEKNVNLADLKSAADAAQLDATRQSIEQAVTNGQLTRAQADWMLQGIDKGYTGMGRGGVFGHGGFLGLGLGASAEGQTGLDAAAKALNMTTDQLSLQLWGGRTLADLAEKAGVKLEDVQNAVETARKDAMKAAIEQAVTDGRITREQGDWMIQGIDNGYTGGRLGGMGGFCGRGGMGGSGEFRGRGDQQPSSPNNAPQDNSGANGAGARFRAPHMSQGRSI